MQMECENLCANYKSVFKIIIRGLIELENRGLHLRGISLSSIWFIENIPIINMQDIDFSLPIGKDSTNSRVTEHMETISINFSILIEKQILNIQLPNFMTYE